jgi:tetratricopeptide (TPR) repeat protein
MNARIDRLNELLKQSPNDAFIRFALAKEMEKSGQYEEAVERLAALLDDNPEYVGAYYHLGGLLLHLDKRNEAVRIYEKGISEAAAQNDTHALAELRQALAGAVGEQ